MIRFPILLRRQSGFAYIAAVIFLVVIAGVAVVLLRLTDTQQSTVNQALLASRASLAARGGIEWVFNNPAQRCSQAPLSTSNAAPAGALNHLTDFRAESGFLVSVSCSFRAYNEGETIDASGNSSPVVKRIYRIDAVACNGTANTCPDPGSVPRADYVERAQVATICLLTDGTPCV